MRFTQPATHMRVSVTAVKTDVTMPIIRTTAKPRMGPEPKIVHLFEEQGIQIARRTVAKYRDQLGILPARMRKRV